MQKTEVVSKEIEVISDIICNKCGNSCRSKIYTSAFEGLLEVAVRGGYGSSHLGDNEEYVFSLCELCLIKFMDTFTISPDKTYHGGFANQVDIPQRRNMAGNIPTFKEEE